MPAHTAALLKMQDPCLLKGEHFAVKGSKGLLDCKDLVLKSTLSIWDRIKQIFTASPKWVKIEVTQSEKGNVQKVYFNASKFIYANAQALNTTNQSQAVHGKTNAVYEQAPHTVAEFTALCKKAGDKTALYDAIIDVLTQSHRIETKIPKLEQEFLVTTAEAEAAIVNPQPNPTWTTVEPVPATVIQTVTLSDGTQFTGTGIEIAAQQGLIDNKQALAEGVAARAKVEEDQHAARQKAEETRLAEEAAVEKERLAVEAAAEKARARQAEIDGINLEFLNRAPPSMREEIQKQISSEKPVAVVPSAKETTSARDTFLNKQEAALKYSEQQAEKIQAAKRAQAQLAPVSDTSDTDTTDADDEPVVRAAVVRAVGKKDKAPASVEPAKVAQDGLLSLADLLEEPIRLVVEDASKPVVAASTDAPAPIVAQKKSPPPTDENTFITQDPNAKKVLAAQDEKGVRWYEGKTIGTDLLRTPNAIEPIEEYGRLSQKQIEDAALEKEAAKKHLIAPPPKRKRGLLAKRFGL